MTEAFFDFKPGGGFWISQDPSARALLPLIALLMFGGLGSTTRAQSAPPAPDGEEIVARMETSNARRLGRLGSFSSRRRYAAANPRLHSQATLLVEVRFVAPEEKTFRVLEGEGSHAIQKRVFEPMLEIELANSRQPARQTVEISRRNYTFTPAGFDEATRAYIFSVEPHTPNKYLFRGKVWVNAEDFAVQRIEGEPAHRPSFWIRRTHFVHQYARFGEFWFPVSNRTQVELRLFGPSSFDIDYLDYDWQPRVEPAASASGGAEKTDTLTQVQTAARP